MTLIDKADIQEQTAHTGPSKTGTVIPLSNGMAVKVSPEDYDRLSGMTWTANVSKSGKVYAVTWLGIDTTRPLRANGRHHGIRKPIHRIIMDPPSNMVVDHINGDTLDNRRENLRVCTHRQNILNSEVARGGGVQFCKQTQKWFARPTLNGERVFLGRFSDRDEAERAVHSARLESGDAEHVYAPTPPSQGEAA